MQKRKLVASLDEFNEIMVQVGVKLVTILVPLPSAVSLFSAMSAEVGWLGAFIMALVIELFGLAAVDNNYLSWLNKDKVNPRVSYAVTAGYVVVAEAVIYAFKVWNHSWVNSVYMLFPLLSIMGFVLLMNRRTIDDANRQSDVSTSVEVERLEQVIEQQYETLSNERSERSTLVSEHALTLEAKELEIERLQSVLSDMRVQVARLEGASQVVQPERLEHQPERKSNAKLNKTEAMDRMLEVYNSNPDASLNDVAKILGKGKSTVSGYLKELEAKGRVHVNGSVLVK